MTDAPSMSNQQLADYVLDVSRGMRFVVARYAELMEDAGVLSVDAVIADLKRAVAFGEAQAGNPKILPGELAFTEGVANLLKKRKLLRAHTGPAQ